MVFAVTAIGKYASRSRATVTLLNDVDARYILARQACFWNGQSQTIATGLNRKFGHGPSTRGETVAPSGDIRLGTALLGVALFRRRYIDPLVNTNAFIGFVITSALPLVLMTMTAFADLHHRATFGITVGEVTKFEIEWGKRFICVVTQTPLRQ